MMTKRYRLKVNNRTGVAGVDFFKGKYRARATINGKQWHLGLYDTIEEAAQAMDRARRRYYAPMRVA